MMDGREIVRVTRRSEPLQRLMMEPLALFGGGELGLQWFFGLLDGDGLLALDIATRSMAGPTVITRDEETAILAMRPGELPPRGADVPEAVTLFGAMLTPGQSLVEACRHHPNATVMRMLLDAGVTPVADDVREELPDQAERLGAPELAARLRAGRS